MDHPIPTEALDDRLGFIGTSGSGKTYNSGGAVERLLRRKARVVIVDPLGVWWGLRLLADGATQSPYNVPIFGGAHGDLPLTEHAGALIGETAANMAESCIIDLSQLGTKSAERRFMTAFLETIYRKARGEPFHLVVDEADLFAPQKPPKGDETLLNLMEQIVRRGRVKGFIPWLISQRPAVLNKNVLSQVDGLIAFKLTASQDRDALDGWIEGQADKVQGKAIKDGLPTLQTGQGVVWVPGRGVLRTAAFPKKITFDSSRTPKRGETVNRIDLKPLDLSALKGRLATVEKEAAENDPRALKSEIARLKRELGTKGPTVDRSDVEAEIAASYSRGKADGAGEEHQRWSMAIKGFASDVGEIVKAHAAINPILGRLERIADMRIEAPAASITTVRKMRIFVPAEPRGPRPSNGTAPVEHRDGISGPQQRILDALAELELIGVVRAARIQVAFLSGYGHLNSKGFVNALGALRSGGKIEYPETGAVSLTPSGRALANRAGAPLTSNELHERVLRLLGNQHGRILSPLIASYPDAMERQKLAEAAGYGHLNSKGFVNAIGRLRSLGFIDYPASGRVVALPILFVD